MSQGNAASTSAANLAQLFLQRVEKSGDREAFRIPENGDWTSITWKQAADRVEPLAAGLLSLGVEPEDRVGIASTTRLEWILADLAILCSGGATTTVYPSTNAEDTAYILADSDSKIVFAEDESQLEKLTERRSELPNLTKVVLFDGNSDDDWVISLDDLADEGAKYLAEHANCVRKIAEETKPEQLATLIYTSGTTGKPKGVRLRHKAWVYDGAVIESMGLLSEDDVQLLWLPLAHAFGKVLISTQLACGFASAIDGRVDKIVENTGVVKPTFMGAAPRIFEKAYSKYHHAAEKALTPSCSTGRSRWGRRSPPPTRRQIRVAAFGAAGAAVRPAGVLEDPRRVRRADSVLHLRFRAAQPRHRRMVRGGRFVDPRGLRADRVVGSGFHQPAGQLQARHRRSALRGHRGPDQRRRRGPVPQRLCDGRLPPLGRRHRRRAQRGRLAVHR